MSDTNSAAREHAGIITRLSADVEAALANARAKYESECEVIKIDLEAAVKNAEAFGLRVERGMTGTMSAIWQKIA